MKVLLNHNTKCGNYIKDLDTFEIESIHVSRYKIILKGKKNCEKWFAMFIVRMSTLNRERMFPNQSDKNPHKKDQKM